MNFYATISYGEIRDYMPDVSYLLPASSWARGQHKTGKLPPVKLPAHLTKSIAADCGGFVASRKWGEYRYSPAQYVEWLHSFNPEWAATMDYCCEPPLTGNDRREIQKRQTKTTIMAHLFWHEYREAKWMWTPTIQGWEVADYIEHAQELKPLIDEMKRHYVGRDFRVGIGTLCARASIAMIQGVVMGVRSVLPTVKFHLWGVKMNLFKSLTLLPDIASVDSAAWNSSFASNLENERAIRKQHGLTKQRYYFEIALPQYLEKLHKYQNENKQLALI